MISQPSEKERQSSRLSNGQILTLWETRPGDICDEHDIQDFKEWKECVPRILCDKIVWINHLSSKRDECS